MRPRSMSELLVLSFDGAQRASQARQRLHELGREELIKLADACVVTRDEKGRTKLRQAHDLVGAGALGGAFWGALVGILFLMPLAGMAIGSIVGALSGKFGDIGIDDGFIKEVGETVEPGDSALFLLIEDWSEERVLDELRTFEPSVLRTNLSPAEEENLRRAFGAEPLTG